MTEADLHKEHSIWALPPTLRLRLWPEATVVYDVRCGETHVLYPPLTDLLEALSQGPMATAELFEYLEWHYDATPEELDDAMRNALGQLRQRYLVEQVAERRET